jgi:hypothetical protein
MHTGNSCSSPTGTPEVARRRPVPDSRDQHRSDRSSGRSSDRHRLERVQPWPPSGPIRAMPRSSGFAYQPPSNTPSVLRAKVPLVLMQVPCQSAGLEVPWFHAVGRMAEMPQPGRHSNWWCFPCRGGGFQPICVSHGIGMAAERPVELSTLRVALHKSGCHRRAPRVRHLARAMCSLIGRTFA